MLTRNPIKSFRQPATRSEPNTTFFGDAKLDVNTQLKLFCRIAIQQKPFRRPAIRQKHFRRPAVRQKPFRSPETRPPNKKFRQPATRPEPKEN